MRGEFTKLAAAWMSLADDPTTAKVNGDASTRPPSIPGSPSATATCAAPTPSTSDKFPRITFISKKIERAGEGRLKLVGDLTVHGVTKEVTLDVEDLTPAVKDPGGTLRVGAHATTRINRKDFGLLWNKVLEAGGVLVGDEVSITIDVELVKKA